MFENKMMNLLNSLMYEKMIFPVYTNVYVLLKISFNIVDERQLKINSSYNHESAHPCCCFGLYPFHNFISYRYLILNFYVLWQRNLSKIQHIGLVLRKLVHDQEDVGFYHCSTRLFLHTIDLK
jgi:hypothetical protein